ncbi:MAG: hypothetical protein ACI4PP_01690 [Clostridia bacterium]
MKQKKNLLIILLCIVVFAFAGCGNDKDLPTGTASSDFNSEENGSDTDGTKEKSDTDDTEDKDSESGSTEMKEGDNLAPGESVTIHTDNGDLEISVIEAVFYEETDDDSEICPISIRCEVHNISFSDEYAHSDFEAYMMDYNGIMIVKDSSGYSLEFYNLSGPSDGKYAIDKSLQIGEKARVAYLYHGDPKEKTVTVELNGEYQITLNVK